MKKLLKLLVIFLICIVIAIGGHIYYLTTLAAKEKYPEDNYLLNAANKKALIIVAHDDDMAGSSGTITMLCKQGWTIREMCFYQQGGLYLKKDSAKNPIRKQALQEVAAIQGLQGVDPVDFNFRNDMETEKSYMPMPYEQFSKNYKTDSLLMLIGNYIEKYKPTIIFTLDDVMGGYGHPDHTMMSQLVTRYCRQHKNDPGFTVKKIYQPVFPPSLAKRIMGKMEVYNEAKKVYHTEGMPLPDVQVNFYNYAEQKKQCLQAYTTEQNSIKKIWPYYNWYPYWIYFRIFNRDFFRVVDVSRL
jgi:LmbE family N-acetylglucosaminyl deacetylase